MPGIRSGSFRSGIPAGRSWAPRQYSDGQNYILNSRKPLPPCQGQSRSLFPTPTPRPSRRTQPDLAGPILHFRNIRDPRTGHPAPTPRRSSAIHHSKPPLVRGIPNTPYPRYPQQLQRKYPRCAGAHLGYDVDDPTRLHTGWGLVRRRRGARLFRSETSRRRLFARRSGAPRSYQISKLCQASSMGAAHDSTLRSTPEDQCVLARPCRPRRMPDVDNSARNDARRRGATRRGAGHGIC